MLKEIRFNRPKNNLDAEIKQSGKYNKQAKEHSVSQLNLKFGENSRQYTGDPRIILDMWLLATKERLLQTSNLAGRLPGLTLSVGKN